MTVFGALQGALDPGGDERRLFSSFHGVATWVGRAPSAAVPQLLQQEGELFGAGDGCHDPDGCGGDAEDDKEASETPSSNVDGQKFASSIAAVM
ncbi:hypothetical protein D3C80_1155440 [compost metagenome]